MKVTYVTLKVYDDNESREWWQAMGLVSPDRWDEDTFGADVFVRPVLEVVAQASDVE